MASLTDVRPPGQPYTAKDLLAVIAYLDSCIRLGQYLASNTRIQLVVGGTHVRLAVHLPLTADTPTIDAELEAGICQYHCGTGGWTFAQIRYEGQIAGWWLYLN